MNSLSYSISGSHTHTTTTPLVHNLYFVVQYLCLTQRASITVKRKFNKP